MSALKKVNEYLATVPSGRLKDTSDLAVVLGEAWDELSGDDYGMEGYKLHRRMENVLWEPPRLIFTIERHGWTVMGSSRAELHRWTVDVNEGTANCESIGYRQVYPRQRPLDVKPLAEEIAELIVRGMPDERLKWGQDGSVQVLTGRIIPATSACRQTIIGRRRRFRQELASLLKQQGYHECWGNWYVPSSLLSV